MSSGIAAFSSAQTFFEQFFSVLSSGNYQLLAEIVKLKPSVGNSRDLVARKRVKVDYATFTEEVLELWKSLAESCFRVRELVKTASNSNINTEAASEQITAITTFLRVFSDSSQLPLLYVLGEDAWWLVKGASASSEVKEQAARAINRLFIACITERTALTAKSRKWGTYRVAGLLLRVYFALGQLNLMPNVLKALQACELPPIQEFPRAHTVTFSFFIGKYHFAREDYEAAESCFEFCLLSCHDSTKKASLDACSRVFSHNLQQILNYLIPIKLILSACHPSETLFKLLRDSEEAFYRKLINCIGKGDLGAYDQLIEENSSKLLARDSRILFERLRLLAFRQLLRRIHLALEGSTRLSLQLIKAMIEADGANFIELLDVACQVSNLIARGMMKGYVSEERQFLVLSAQDPFPSLPHGSL